MRESHWDGVVQDIRRIASLLGAARFRIGNCSMPLLPRETRPRLKSSCAAMGRWCLGCRGDGSAAHAGCRGRRAGDFSGPGPQGRHDQRA